MDIDPLLPPPPPEAVEPGVAYVQFRAQVPPGARLHVTFELKAENGETLGRQNFSVGEGAPQTSSVLRPGELLPENEPDAGAPKLTRRVKGWIGLALAIYMLVRLIGLADYPIYFFTDEAIQTVLASDFIRDEFYNYDHEYLPPYFKNVYQYNLGVSVYLQVLPLQLFGKSVEVTRGVNVLVSLIAAISCGLALLKIFRQRYPWLGILVLSATPAWFLHSRTAFETSLAVSFYAGFLYCYLLYRNGQARAIYAAVVFGALSFYSYSPAQMVLAVTAFLLGLSDFRYHWQQRKVLLRALGLGLLLATPYFRFQIMHPGETLNHLKQIGSYWIQPISVWDKLRYFLSAYLSGLNPAYWFAPNTVDLERHVMDSYGHLLRYALPFGLLGTWISLKNWRHWEHRTLLLAALAAPSGAALVELGITRVLFMVIPAALLTSLGMSAVIEWFVWRVRLPRVGVALAFGLLAAGFNFYLLGDALLRGPTWSTNYSLTGMQYGARQVFSAALEFAAGHPGERLEVSPTWANGTDVLARFFTPDQSPVVVNGVESYINEQRPLDDKIIFILSPEDYESARKSGKFKEISVVLNLPYPNREPGFFFVRLRYVDDIALVFKREAEERRAMVKEEVKISHELADVRFSRLDMGEIKYLFDGDPDSLVRSAAANPFQLEVSFRSPRYLSESVLRIGSAATTVEVAVQVEGEDKARFFEAQATESSVIHDVWIQFKEMLLVNQIYFKIKNSNETEPAHVHLWEVTFK